jgi:uncharacterized membrane protein YjjB (DUF3815 family)
MRQEIVIKLAFLYHIFVWPLAMSVGMLGAILTPGCQPQLGAWLAATAAASFVISAIASHYAARASHRWLA